MNTHYVNLISNSKCFLIQKHMHSLATWSILSIILQIPNQNYTQLLQDLDVYYFPQMCQFVLVKHYNKENNAQIIKCVKLRTICAWFWSFVIYNAKCIFHAVFNSECSQTSVECFSIRVLTWFRSWAARCRLRCKHWMRVLRGEYAICTSYL